MKKILMIVFVVLIVALFTYCSNSVDDSQSQSSESSSVSVESSNELSAPEDMHASDENEQLKETVYSNNEYGFDFKLPESWLGFSIVFENWEGHSISGENEKIQTGPKILIRNPNWSESDPRQDIPIMVFTHEQWDELQKEEMSVGAAPINPSKLGENSKYVFALPARYNFSFQTGYEEVEDIIAQSPLIATENIT